MSWRRSKMCGNEEIKKLNEEEGAQSGNNVLHFTRHRVKTMSEVNDWSLHANVESVV